MSRFFGLACSLLLLLAIAAHAADQGEIVVIPLKGEVSQARFFFIRRALKTAERELVGEDGVVVPLSTGEFRMLVNLVQRPRIVLSRDQLLELTQGRDATIFDRSVDNQISRLRKKIEPDLRNPTYIKTVWGGGYVFAADVRQL